MIEATNIYAERRLQPRRNDSFSTTDSIAEIVPQYKDSNMRLQERPIFMANNSLNVKFHNSESIHVGNIVYHIHHHSKKRNDDKDSDSIRSDSFGSVTVEANFVALSSSVKKKKFGIRFTAVISIILMFISATVASYFALWRKGTELVPTTTEYTTLSATSSAIESDPTVGYTTAEYTTTIEYTTTTDSYFNIYDYKNGIDRRTWGALPPKSLNIPKLNLPIKRIIIGHTGGDFCSSEEECIETVKSLQFLNPDLDDIAYNFLFGGDGKIYEGRGFTYQGQHTQNLDATEYNSIGIGIAFIGNYAAQVPSFKQFDLLRDFIETFVKNRIISNDYTVVSQDDLKYSQTKAAVLNNVIRNLQSYRPLHKIHRREEWGAQKSKGTPNLYNEVSERVVIDHSATPQCDNLEACKARAKSLQDQSFDRRFDDISYNIFFGADGLVFEGRGWDVEASHHNGLNVKMINIGAIGNYTSVSPNQGMIGAMLHVFSDAMVLGKLTNDFRIFGLSDFESSSSGPGSGFMKVIKAWCRYGHGTRTCT